MTQSGPIAIYVDADACPVKEEVYRVAERHRIKVYVVANAFMAVPRDPRRALGEHRAQTHIEARLMRCSGDVFTRRPA